MGCPARNFTSEYSYQLNCHQVLGVNAREVFEYISLRMGESGRIRIDNAHLASHFGVSLSTIKRKLVSLYESRLLKYTCVKDGNGHSIRTLEIDKNRIAPLLKKRKEPSSRSVNRVENKVNHVINSSEDQPVDESVTRFNHDLNAVHLLNHSLSTSSNSHLLREEKELHLVSFLEMFNKRSGGSDNAVTFKRIEKFKLLKEKLTSKEDAQKYIDKIFSTPFLTGELGNPAFTIDQLLMVKIYDKVMKRGFDPKDKKGLPSKFKLLMLAYLMNLIAYKDLPKEVVTMADKNNIDLGRLKRATEYEVKHALGFDQEMPTLRSEALKAVEELIKP